MDKIDRFSRSRLIFKDGFNKLQNAKVLVCGCGGVGGAVIDALYRSGVTNLSVIDRDKFDVTNQNRQLLSQNIGKYKALTFEENYEGVKGFILNIDEEFINSFNFTQFDFVIDAIDDVEAKILLAKRLAYKKNLKPIFYSSMGAAKRVDPTKIAIDDIFKTSNDALAKKIRTKLKKDKFRGNYKVVYSKEEPLCKELGSCICVTANFGLHLASLTISEILKKS